MTVKPIVCTCVYNALGWRGVGGDRRPKLLASGVPSPKAIAQTGRQAVLGDKASPWEKLGPTV